jgi:hypothetical protein
VLILLCCSVGLLVFCSVGLFASSYFLFYPNALSKLIGGGFNFINYKNNYIDCLNCFLFRGKKGRMSKNIDLDRKGMSERIRGRNLSLE